MYTADIEREIHSFVVTNFLFGEPLDLQPDDSLLGRGLIDSTGVLELIAFLQERYSIKIPDQEATPENLDSVKKATTYVANKLNHTA